MQLFAYNPIGKPDELLIWVGVRGVVTPPAIAFEVNGQPLIPQTLAVPFEHLGDGVYDANNRALNHRAIFSFRWPATYSRFSIAVIAGDQRVTLTSKQPPEMLPEKNADSFNILLSSCYYQRNDRALPLAQLVKRIKPAPDFTVLAGDQVYLDLPSLQNLPREKRSLARALGKKYQFNWFSESMGQPGLAGLLRQGPVLCIPDDHEFWNNYPLFQVQLDNTHRKEDRANWGALATQLFVRYQMSPAQRNGFFRRDITPLNMLFLDSRTRRDRRGKHMFNAATQAAITRWKQDLLKRKRHNQPAIGLLSSGQALVIEKPGVWERHLADMEMVNYEDFAVIKDALDELFIAEIPVIYLTGDVHWGRILEGKNQRGKILFYEIISSPSRLIDTVISDQKKEIQNKIRNFFGAPEPFPRHPEAPGVAPDIKFATIKLETLHRQQGDHVALLRFHAIPGGLEFHIDYVCTDPNEKKRRAYSSSHGPFKLTSQ